MSVSEKRKNERSVGKPFTSCPSSAESNKSSKYPQSNSKCSSQQRKIDAIFNSYSELLTLPINVKNVLSDENKSIDYDDKSLDYNFDEDLLLLGTTNIAGIGENYSKLLHLSQEPWPDSVKLFQPYEVEQILLPDQASCLAVQAFLKMCNLPFEVEMRWNAEFMSPSGRVPFIKCGAFVVSELEPIVQFASNKGISLCSRLATEEKAEMRAYMSLITNVLVNAELYISWLDNETFNAVTKVRNSSVYPWPLGWLQTRSKRNSVAKRLKALHWHDKTLDQVLADVEQCCNSLSQRLGDKDYFFGTNPTPLDALVYGHMRALLSSDGPKAGLLIKPISTALLRHLIRVTSLVGLKLTPQEDYLLSQACHMSHQRSMSNITDSSRRRGSKTFANRAENARGQDLFGFKPFASKKVLIMTTEKGKITSHIHGHEGWYTGNDNRYSFITELLEDILDKVDEIVIDRFARNVESDFEVISSCAEDDVCASKTASTIKNSDGLDTIEELTDISMSIEDYIDNVVDPINRDVVASASGAFDSDGVVNDRLLSSSLVPGHDDDRDHSPLSKSLPVTSTPENETDTSLTNKDSTITCFDDGKSGYFEREGSASTLKTLSDEDTSVEGLMRYLRKHNALCTSDISIIADTD